MSNTERPVLRNCAGTFEVAADNHEWLYGAFADAVAILKFLSAPDVEYVGACGWQYEVAGFEGEREVRVCEAPVAGTARGWRCANGHEHVSAEVRYTEGWDYATEDEIEASRTQWLGYEPRSVSAGWEGIELKAGEL